MTSYRLLVLLALGGAMVGCNEPQPPETPAVAAPAVEAPTPEPATAASRSTELAMADGALLEQLSAQAAVARRRGLKPVLYAHADWCPPCNAIDAHAADPSMRAAFADTFLIKVDVDVWGDQLEPHGIGGVIPMWIALDDEGRPGERRIDGGAWAEDIPANMAGPLGAFFRSI